MNYTEYFGMGTVFHSAFICISHLVKYLTYFTPTYFDARLERIKVSEIRKKKHNLISMIIFCPRAALASVFRRRWREFVSLSDT